MRTPVQILEDRRAEIWDKYFEIYSIKEYDLKTKANRESQQSDLEKLYALIVEFDESISILKNIFNIENYE